MDPVRTEGDASPAALAPVAGDAGGGGDRWPFIRDVAVFQLKLFIDGLRDLVLAPLALAAGIVGLVSGRDRARQLFYDVLRLGWRAEGWINLFGVVADEEKAPPERAAEHAVDDYVVRIEEALRRQCEKGGFTAATKQRIDTFLDNLGRGRQQG